MRRSFTSCSSESSGRILKVVFSDFSNCFTTSFIVSDGSLSDTDIIGCFHAAYSGENGIIGHYSTGKKRKVTSDYRYTTINLDGNTHFQQVSLVRNHNPKKFSDNRLRYRRALCKKDGKYFIIQSKYPITLNRFAENLTDNDFAWNLDMGTYPMDGIKRMEIYIK